MQSLLDHPLWPRIRPHLQVVRGDHVRAGFERLPRDLADELRLVIGPCLHCGRATFPLRVRAMGGAGLYATAVFVADYQPYCLTRPACALSLRVNHELGKLAMEAADLYRNPPLQLESR